MGYLHPDWMMIAASSTAALCQELKTFATLEQESVAANSSALFWRYRTQYIGESFVASQGHHEPS